MPTVQQDVIRGTADFAGALGVDRVKRSFSDEIFLMEANAMPLTTLARSMKKISIPAIKREWLEDEIVPETVTLAEAIVATETAWTVDAGHGSRVSVDDILWNPDLTKTERALRVTASDSSTVFTVARGVVGTAVTFSTNSVFLNIGPAMAQGSNIPEPKSTVEVLRTNNIQRMRSSFKLTREATHVATYGDDPLSYQRRKTLLELMRKIEMLNFFGEGGVGDGLSENITAATRDPNMANGVWQYLDDNAPAALIVGQDATSSAVSTSTINDLVRDVYLNKGPHEPGQKVLFAAPAIITDLEGIHDGGLRITPEDTVGGVKVRKWQTSFGDIAIVNHPLLATPSGLANQNWGFLLDMQEISQVVQEGLDLEYEEIDLRKTTGEEAIVGEWKISQCLEVKGSAGVHGVLRMIND